MYMTGEDCHIMWTLSKNISTINRDGMSVDEQKKIFGWPEINPTERTVKTKYPRIKLNNQKSCSNNKSECKMTCKMIINDLNYRYPKPRDCIVGDWEPWGKCSKTCGGGIQTRIRKVKYPAQFGGQKCPPLENKRVCNTQTCSSPNFTEETDAGFYKNNKLQFLGWTPSTARGTGRLKECQADCDTDRDCAPGLKCFERRGNEKVPGCEGSAVRGADYCIPKERFLKDISVNGRSNPKLGLCEGDCDRDTDCQDGLKCFQRNGYTPVPGCVGRGRRDWDYCVPKSSTGSYKTVGTKYCNRDAQLTRWKSGDFFRHIVNNYDNTKSQKTIDACKRICDQDSNCKAFAVSGYERNLRDSNNRIAPANCTTYNKCSLSRGGTSWTNNGRFKFYVKQ